jgi:hypothetical protein
MFRPGGFKSNRQPVSRSFIDQQLDQREALRFIIGVSQQRPIAMMIGVRLAHCRAPRSIAEMTSQIRG